MAYNVIPKTEPEMRAQSRHMTAADEVIRLYSYLTEQVPSVTDPIAKPVGTSVAQGIDKPIILKSSI